jgi:hypothetical protein
VERVQQAPHLRRGSTGKCGQVCCCHSPFSRTAGFAAAGACVPCTRLEPATPTARPRRGAAQAAAASCRAQPAHSAQHAARTLVGPTPGTDDSCSWLARRMSASEPRLAPSAAASVLLTLRTQLSAAASLRSGGGSSRGRR